MTDVPMPSPLGERLSKLESLLPDIERLPDVQLRETVREIVQTVLDFHGEAVERMVAVLEQQGPTGRKLLAELAGDQLVSSLLLLYGLHPSDFASRVAAALESVRPLLASHGGSVSLLDVTPDGEVSLRLEGSCHGCGSSQATLKSTIEQALYAAAPEIAAIHVEGLAPPAPAGGFVSIGDLAATATVKN